MISKRTIDTAIARGILTATQAGQLQAIETEALATPDSADDEALRFVSGFADIFVSLGLALFLGALAYLMDNGAGSTPMYAGLAACAWLLAEVFTRKRRMALPSIVLLVVFVVAILFVSLQLFGSLLPPARQLPERLWFLPTQNPGALAAAAVVTVGLSALHYIHFRVPVTIAAGTAALCIFAFGVIALSVPDLGDASFNLFLLACGLAVFALAMHFDMSDPARSTRLSDVAFWLHLLAAPLIVQPLIRGLLHGLDGRLTTGAALGILWIFLGLGAIAVIIDRRAILVSGLTYAGVAFGTLVHAVGVTATSLALPIVLLVLGAFILLVSAGWQPLRRAILKRLPLAFARRLPHPLTNSATS